MKCQLWRRAIRAITDKYIYIYSHVVSQLNIYSLLLYMWQSKSLWYKSLVCDKLLLCDSLLCDLILYDSILCKSLLCRRYHHDEVSTSDHGDSSDSTDSLDHWSSPLLWLPPPDPPAPERWRHTRPLPQSDERPRQVPVQRHQSLRLSDSWPGPGQPSVLLVLPLYGQPWRPFAALAERRTRNYIHARIVSRKRPVWLRR